MSALRDFQTTFAGYLTGSSAEAPAMVRRFIGSDHLENASIYRNNVRHAHVGALAAIYPAIRALVGDDYFDSLAFLYSRVSPPASSILAGYGSGFDVFLAGRPELSRISFLPDVARLEWAMNEAFHAHSSLPLSPDRAVQYFAAGATGLGLVASVRLLDLRHDALEIRAAALQGDAGRIAALPALKQHLVVFQAAGSVAAERLSAGEIALLKGLMESEALESAVAHAHHQDSDFTPAEAIGRLLHLGVFRAPTTAKQGNLL